MTLEIDRINSTIIAQHLAWPVPYLAHYDGITHQIHGILFETVRSFKDFAWSLCLNIGLHRLRQPDIL